MGIPRRGDPLALFHEWYAEAQQLDIEEPTAVTLATADARGRPSARMVLLKGADENGFVFYTNLASRKGRELQENPYAALCFYWMSLGKQVRVEGPAAQVTDEEADDYFATRGRQSQIGAWASKQSQPLDTRFALEKRVAKYALKFGAGAPPRPPFWSGFRIRPESIEFWQAMPFRLHDRLRYARGADGEWTTENLFP